MLKRIEATRDTLTMHYPAVLVEGYLERGTGMRQRAYGEPVFTADQTADHHDHGRRVVWYGGLEIFFRMSMTR